MVQDVVLGEEPAAYVRLIRTRPLYVVVHAPGAGRAKSGYGAGWTVAELDRVLRVETPRIGLWPDTSELTVGETVEEIPAGRQRARVV